MVNQITRPIPCIACRVDLIDPAESVCARCGADNQTWQAWQQAGWVAQGYRFFVCSVWGWLALISLLLPPLTWGIFAFNLYSLETAMLVISLLLSITGLIYLFVRREELWLAELMGQIPPRSHWRLLQLGGVGFLGFISVTGLLTITDLSQGVGWPWILTMSLVFIVQTFSAILYATYSYGQWRFRSFPKPIFVRDASLLRVVTPTLQSLIQSESGWGDTMTIQMVEMKRTQEAGLDLKVRAEVNTDKVFNRQFLKAIQYWRVMTDPWGKIQHTNKDSPLEYIFDAEREYMPPKPDPARPALEGEIIFPEKIRYRNL